jgi:hypothetical protein
MIERLMKWLGYVPKHKLNDATWKVVELMSTNNKLTADNLRILDANIFLGDKLAILRQYSHVRKIEANIETGKARKK